MDIERAFLTSVLQHKAVGEAIDENVTEELFEGTARLVWRWATDHYSRYSESPGLDALFVRFPEYDPMQTTEGQAYWAEHLRKRYLYNVVNDCIRMAVGHTTNDDPMGAVNALRPALIAMDTVASRSPDVDWSRTAERRLKEYDNKSSHNGVDGYPYPFPTLNRVLGGIHAGELIYVVAPTGTGKTFLQVDLAHHLWGQGLPVLLLSKEMTAEQIMRRIDALHAGLPYSEFRAGTLDEEAYEKYRDTLLQLDESGTAFVVCDEPSGGVAAAMAKVERHRPRACFIDGFYLMDDDRGAKSGWERIANISRDLKRLAKQFNIPVIVTAQLNADGDVAFYKGVLQDADAMFELEQTPDDRHMNRMRLLTRKVREGARIAPLNLVWDLRTMTIEEEKEDITEFEE
jgi:replicative DNA helicase